MKAADVDFLGGGQPRMEELCIVCSEFGKDKELWYRCVNCGKWTHALCTIYDSAENFNCGSCI